MFIFLTLFLIGCPISSGTSTSSAPENSDWREISSPVEGYSCYTHEKSFGTSYSHGVFCLEESND